MKGNDQRLVSWLPMRPDSSFMWDQGLVVKAAFGPDRLLEASAHS